MYQMNVHFFWTTELTKEFSLEMHGLCLTFKNVFYERIQLPCNKGKAMYDCQLVVFYVIYMPLALPAHVGTARVI